MCNSTNIYTVGTAYLIPAEGFKYVASHVNPAGIVPMIASVFCIGNGATKINTGYCSGNLLSPVKDHLLDSEGHDEVVQELCQRISKKAR